MGKELWDPSIYSSDSTREFVAETIQKIAYYFAEHTNIEVNVSGGSDSSCIVHLICKYFPEFIPKCHFVFVNTGLEYEATKRHLCVIERNYGIQIDRIRGRSIVSVVKEFGLPILNKRKSDIISRYINGSKFAERYILTSEKLRRGDLRFTPPQVELAQFIKEEGILISSQCCQLSKKEPLHKYQQEHNIDLVVTGERKAEGGARVLANTSCFKITKAGHRYMPLWWWSDGVKKDFKESEGIIYSDCYEKWGMKRTGCVGCPFNVYMADDLQKLFVHEPKVFKACMNVFGEAYELTDRFRARVHRMIPFGFQLSLTQEYDRLLCHSNDISSKKEPE